MLPQQMTVDVNAFFTEDLVKISNIGLEGLNFFKMYSWSV